MMGHLQVLQVREYLAAAAVCALVAIAGIANGEPTAATPTTTSPASSRPALTSLNGIRLDERMTLFSAGERLEPTVYSDEGVDSAAPWLVELPSHRDLLVSIAARRSTTRPTVRVLPEASRTSAHFGIVRIDHAILRKTPVASSPGNRDNLSDATRSEPLWILDQDDTATAYLVHAADGYVGWIDATAVKPIEAEAFVGIVNADRGDSGTAKVDRVLAAARATMGTRYVWGGKTLDGIDCSGLAQTAFAAAGVMLPRDADQQSLVGRLVATRYFTDALLPGDLLYYVSPQRGNVHHVAIYLGDGAYIEAAGPDVHVRSMTPGAAGYDAKRAATFGWARRVID